MKKQCSKCHDDKELNQFYKKAGSKDGYRNECKYCIKNYNSQYYQENKEEIKEEQKRYYLDNIEWATQYNINYKTTHKVEIQKHQKQYRQTPARKKAKNEYERNKRQENINYKLSCYLRSRINKAIAQRTGSAIQDLGCPIEFLIQYLEGQFYTDKKTNKQMTWDNYGEWHIDDIIPLSFFNLNDREQFLKACHYTNLQPLWWWDNLSKGDRLNEE